MIINKNNGDQSIAGLEAIDKEWQEFSLQSAVKIADNEKRIGLFKQQVHKIGKHFKAKYEFKLLELENENDILKKKMEDYAELRAAQDNEFIIDFNQGMNHLT